MLGGKKGAAGSGPGGGAGGNAAAGGAAGAAAVTAIGEAKDQADLLRMELERVQAGITLLGQSMDKLNEIVRALSITATFPVADLCGLT